MRLQGYNAVLTSAMNMLASVCGKRSSCKYKRVLFKAVQSGAGALCRYAEYDYSTSQYTDYLNFQCEIYLARIMINTSSC